MPLTLIGTCPLRAGPFFWFARHGHNLTGASPQRGLIAASAQPKTRVSIVRWNLKEVSGKSLALKDVLEGEGRRTCGLREGVGGVCEY